MKVTVTFDIEPEELTEMYQKTLEANNTVVIDNINEFYSTMFQNMMKAGMGALNADN